MAHTLRIYYNAGTTLDFSTAPWKVLEYEPVTPTVSPIIESSEMEDGEELLRSTLRNVKESAVLLLQPSAGQNMTQVQAQVELLEKIISEAMAFQEDGGKGYPTYLEFQPEGTSEMFRSEILGGQVEVDGGGNMRNWAIADSFIVRLSVYRRYYWEGSAVTLTFENSSGNGTTRTVYNRDEATAGYDNYVTIHSSTPVTGVLPTPLYLAVENTYATGRTKRFYLGLSTYIDTSASLTLDDSIGTGYNGQVDNDAMWNNGQAWRYTMTVSEARMISWTIASASLLKFRGRYFHVFVRTGKLIKTDHYIRLKVRSSISGNFVAVADTGEIHVDSTRELQDLGVVQIPPNLNRFQDLADHYLDVYGYSDTAGEYFYIDYILLMPADSFQVATCIDVGLAQHWMVVMDEANKQVYAQDDSGMNRIGHVSLEGRTLMLRPGESHKLIIMAEADDGTVAIARTTQILGHFHPRRLTV